jgi:hypothetical protein
MYSLQNDTSGWRPSDPRLTIFYFGMLAGLIMYISLALVSSPELRDQVNFSDQPFCPLSVCLSIKLLHFWHHLRNNWANFNRLRTNHRWEEGIQMCTNEGQYSCPRGGNSRTVKIHWKFLEIFSRTSRPI